MVTLGAAPYPGKMQKKIFEMLKAGYRMPQPPSCSKELYCVVTECWQWDALKRPTFEQLMKKLENIRVNGDDILGKQSAQIEPLDEDAKLFYQEDIESQKKNADVISLNSNQSLQEALLCEGDIPLSSTPEK